VKAIAAALGVGRSNSAAQAIVAAPYRRGRPPQPDTELSVELEKVIAGQPIQGYHRVHALIRRRRREDGGAAVSVKRVYRDGCEGLLVDASIVGVKLSEGRRTRQRRARSMQPRSTSAKRTG